MKNDWSRSYWNKTKINIVKNFINRFDSANKQNIEKQLQRHEWIIKLIGDQLQKDKTYTFGENFENYNLQKQDKFNSNVTLWKKTLNPLISEEGLKDLPSIFTQIPTDEAKKIEVAKEFFSSIIKQAPPESYKKLKIDYNVKNNINITEIDEDDKSI